MTVQHQFNLGVSNRSWHGLGQVNGGSVCQNWWL